MGQFKVVGKNNEKLVSAKKTSWLDVLKMELKARKISYLSFIKDNASLYELVYNNENEKEKAFQFLEKELGIDKDFWERMYNQNK